ncbi:MAG: S8 family serine peptidase [Chloroherpetonaceae bacterium]|nr:S8 family serine peptidase [Chloroherpetonaceae bacterium]MCS7210072.1 S8 family serine peptidase [Chloroherpetonaceae bacterium]MDW8020607.1 S8 family serine peptidase [Chloroherpetonaceae bacterium]
MQAIRSLVLSLTLLVVLSLSSCRDQSFSPQLPEEKPTVQKSTVIEGHYIVVFKDFEAAPELTASQKTRLRTPQYAELQAVRNKVDDLAALYGIDRSKIERTYSYALQGFAAELTEAQVEALRKDPRVAYVEPDQEVTLSYTVDDEPKEQAELMNQTTPWGITRVGGAVNAAGLSRWAWVVDSGIQLDHPDLTVNTTFARTFVNEPGGADDRNGHGTHVAGTIAARNNTIGVVGVAAGATVVPVKVFGASGSSSNSIIISGIDYVTANAVAGDVCNMSLGGGASTAVDDAVRRCAARGIRCAVAAGNSSANANNYSPARVNGTNIWTVSAHDVNDRFASFSNYGNPPIDWCAPGVNVNSTWIGSGYRSISGTSMATPHVAGILLVNNGVINERNNINGTRYVIGDPDSSPDRLARR